MEELKSVDTFEGNDEKFEVKRGNKKSIIIFSKLNKYFLIPFLCPIFYTLSDYFEDLILQKNNYQNFFDIIFTDLSYIFAGLFFFIPYFKFNFNRKNDSSSNNSGIKYIYNEVLINNYNPCKIILLIISLSLIIVFQNFLFNFTNDEDTFEIRIYIILCIPLFSKIILKENIYKHQYFSIVISIIGIIFIVVPVCLVFNLNAVLSNIIVFINGIMFSLFYVLIKYLVEKYYISPLKISLITGILALFLDCIVSIIYSLIRYHDLSYLKNAFDFSQEENKFKISIYIILYNLFKLLQQFFVLLALFYFSPTLLIITNIISPFLSWIVFGIQDIDSYFKMPDVVLYPIGYIIVIFSALIYNEIIIFNFCGLNKDTKKFVNQRIHEELEDIMKTQEVPLSDISD